MVFLFLRENESGDELIRVKKAKVVLMIVSYLSLIPTAGMLIISLANAIQISNSGGSK